MAISEKVALLAQWLKSMQTLPFKYTDYFIVGCTETCSLEKSAYAHHSH